jgi:hypothetical protein
MVPANISQEWIVTQFGESTIAVGAIGLIGDGLCQCGACKKSKEGNELHDFRLMYIKT